MEREQSSDQGKSQPRSGRIWAERYSGPFRYRRFTDTGVGKDGPMDCIFFKVEVPPNHPEVETTVYEVFNGAKKLPRLSPGQSGYRHTGLSFSREPRHGRVWRLPDTPEGRNTADVIQARLDELAEKLKMEQGPAR
jgi:hypothetical protein